MMREPGECHITQHPKGQGDTCPGGSESKLSLYHEHLWGPYQDLCVYSLESGESLGQTC